MTAGNPHMALDRKKMLLLSVGFLLSLILFIPMSWALNNFASGTAAGLAARSVHGTIWSGRADDIRIFGADLGRLDSSVDAPALFLGRLQMNVSGRDNKEFFGVFYQSLTGKKSYEVNGQFPLRSFPGPVGIKELQLNDFSTQFSGGKCSKAGGTVRAILDGPMAERLSMGSNMLGEAGCRNGNLVINFISMAGTEKISFDIDAHGKYNITVSLTSVMPEVAAILPAYGFQPIVGGYHSVTSGQF